MLKKLRIALAVALVAGGCGTPGRPGPASSAYDPSRALGPLFHDVQTAGVFPDSKTAKPLIGLV